MAATMLSSWIKSQKVQGLSVKNASVFYRNLEEALDVRRKDHVLYTLKQNLWRQNLAVDFCSNDILSLGASGALRKEFMAELTCNPDLTPGAGGSRMMDGNYDYLELVEKEAARFHRAETGLIVGSGYEANIAIFAAIPRPGDAIVFDELVHASTHDGMQQSLATCRIPFRHNDIDAFRDALESIIDSQPLILEGKRSVLVAVESIYSMEGDICPLQDLVEIAKEMFPAGNCQFIVDEAHSTGVIGSKGAGLVNHLGLENDIALRLHTFGKALASAGAIILGNKTIKTALTNFARSVIYTTAPSFPDAAAIRSGYRLLKCGHTKAAQDTIQRLAAYFFTTTISSTILQEAAKKNILSIPLSEDWNERPFQSHIIPLWTKHSYWLTFHLSLAKYCAFPVEYPTVPKGTNRVRITLHACNTEAEVDGLIAAICDWASEMLQIERNGSGEKIPRAARQVYAWMNAEDVEDLTVRTSDRGPVENGIDAEHQDRTTPSPGPSVRTSISRLSSHTFDACTPQCSKDEDVARKEVVADEISKVDVVVVREPASVEQTSRLKKRFSFFRLRKRFRHQMQL